MKNSTLFFTTLLILLFITPKHQLHAQLNDDFVRNKKSTLSFNTDKNKSDNVGIYNNAKKSTNNSSLKKIKETKRYCLYSQTHNNIDIYSATLKVNFNNKGEEIFSNNNTLQTYKVLDATFPTQEFIKNNIEISNGKIVKFNKTYFPVNENLIVAAAEVNVEINNLLYKYIINSENQILYKNCLSFSKKHNTTTLSEAKGSVFMPDPITSARVEYGGSITHNKGQSSAIIEAQQVEVKLMCKLENGVYYLENNDVKMVDVKNPNWDVVTSTDGNFIFNRYEIGFQQVNAFYHLSEIAKQIDNYGFTDAVDFAISVDADGFNGADNSFFHPYSNDVNGELIEFGAYNGTEDHIPDAEDTEVVIHEYTHAIIDSYNSNRISNERYTMEEGFCDYMAVSYTYPLGDYNWQKIFKWDGNLSWNGRSAVSDKCYTDISRFSNNYYEHSDLWTSALLDIYFILGKELTDKLVLHTITGLTGNTTMKQAADIMLEMDIQFFNGNNQRTISTVFKDYCLADKVLDNLTSNSTEPILITIQNTIEFAHSGTATVKFNKASTGNYTLYSTKGVIVKYEEYNNSNSIKVNSEYLNGGVYILNITNSNSKKSFMLVKY